MLVKITFTGINGGCETFRARGDHWFESNTLQEDIPLGAEGTGIIVAIGDRVENLKVNGSQSILKSNVWWCPDAFNQTTMVVKMRCSVSTINSKVLFVNAKHWL